MYHLPQKAVYGQLFSIAIALKLYAQCDMTMDHVNDFAVTDMLLDSRLSIF